MAIYTDNFTDTNGVSLASHTPSGGGFTWAYWSAVSVATASIQSNAFQGTGGAAGGAYYASITPTDADYTVKLRVKQISAGQISAGAVARLATGTASFISLAWNGAASQWELVQFVSGSPTTLVTSSSYSPTTADRDIQIVVVGTTAYAYVDGNLIGQGTTSVTAAGVVGFTVSVTANVAGDNFEFDDNIPPPPNRISNSPNSQTFSVPQSVAVGDLLLLAVAATASGGVTLNASDVTDNLGNTYSLIQSAVFNTSRAALYYCISEFAGTCTITWNNVQTVSLAGRADIVKSILAEGLVTSDYQAVIRLLDSATGSSTTPSISASSLTQGKHDLSRIYAILGVKTASSAISIDAASGYTNIDTEQDGSLYMGFSFDYKTVSEAVQQSVNWGTLASSADWGALLFEVKLLTDAYTTVDETAVDVADGLSATAAGCVFVGEAGALPEPGAGNNISIPYSAEISGSGAIEVDVYNGNTLIKTLTLANGENTLSITPAEYAGITFPWRPIVVVRSV
jgi:hypothetical protein